MELPTPVSQCVSEKRGFPGGSSSAEVLEISPPIPINRTSKSKSFKQKEVIHHEIVDLDLEEDHPHEIIDVDLEEDDKATAHMGRKGNAKEALPNSKAGHSSENDFQLHFDHMDIPPGVEALFLNFPQFNTGVKKPSVSTSSSSQIELNTVSIPHEEPIQIGHLKTSKVGHSTAGRNLKRKQTSMPHNPENNPSPHLVKRRSPRLSRSTLLGNANIPSSYTTLSMPSTSASLMNGGSASAPVLQDSTYIQNGKTPAEVKQRNVDVILQNFGLFNKFDTVEDYSDHHFSKHGSSEKRPPKNWSKRIQEEWKILEKDLPETIFVRVYESRMDLLRAVIVGAEGTPYHDGLFFFDVYFPSSYPNVPPQVHYHSGGLRINPNLYNCGKVCLSLLNTWGGSDKEKWLPGVSTMLQVLVSIQGLILNMKPYFNEPGYARSNGSKAGEENSLKYNESTFMLSLQTMVYNMRRPPKNFKAFVVGHFCKNAREILVSCKAYMEGAQVGCLVKGGVQDVDEGDKSCSKDFRNKLAKFITTLINAFSKIGADDCQDFLYLSQKCCK